MVFARLTLWAFVGKAAAVLLAVGALVVAITATWKAVVWLAKTSERAETLAQIAADFRPNGGNSLRDVVDGLKVTAETAEHNAVAAEAATKENTAATLQNAEELHTLNEYMHDFVHANRTATSVMAGHIQLVTQQVARLEQTVNDKVDAIHDAVTAIEPPKKEN